MIGRPSAKLGAGLAAVLASLLVWPPFGDARAGPSSARHIGQDGEVRQSGERRPLATQSIRWTDLPDSLQSWLEGQRLDEAGFPAWLAAARVRTAVRVREGDEEHVVAYALQSRSFTALPPIEPALSAKAFVSSGAVPADAAARLAALSKALDRPGPDPRLTFFRAVARDLATLRAAYERTMRFLHEKEFGSGGTAAAVAALYQTRGLSTDSAVEAGYAVAEGLSALRSLEPARRIQRVAVIGPGLDLAPRTAHVDDVPPQSIQPFAVIDALLSLGLAELGALDVLCLDVNPRVVHHLAAARRGEAGLRLVTGIAEARGIRLTREYRDYFSKLGSSIGRSAADADWSATARHGKRLAVRAEAARAIHPVELNIAAERLETTVDVAVATNVLAYLTDVELALALANIRAMLADGGVLLHNEARPALHELSRAAALPLEHGRSVTIATVEGGAPLYDTVWLHRAARRGAVTRPE